MNADTKTISRTTEWRRKNPTKAAEHRAREKAAPEYRERHAERNKRYAKANPDKLLARARRQRFGITPQELDAMLQRQHGVCAICFTPLRSHRSVKRNDSLHIDHDHVTGRIRGLLCHSCNKGLGDFRDDPSRMRRAIEYLAANADELKEVH